MKRIFTFAFMAAGIAVATTSFAQEQKASEKTNSRKVTTTHKAIKPDHSPQATSATVATKEHKKTTKKRKSSATR